MIKLDHIKDIINNIIIIIIIINNNIIIIINVKHIQIITLMLIIVDIHVLMAGRTKNIDNKKWTKSLNNINDNTNARQWAMRNKIVAIMVHLVTCIQTKHKIFVNTHKIWRIVNKLSVWHIYSNNNVDKDNLENINKNKWEIYNKWHRKKLMI